MSLDILGIGANALNAFQLGAAISSKNITDSSDPNYCREIVEYSSMVGGGLNVAIKRMSDQFLTSQLNQAQSQASQASTSSTISSSIDQFITGLNGSDKNGPYNLLNKNMQNFLDSLSQLSSNVSESSCQDVISQAGTLSNTLNTISSYLNNQMDNADSKIKDNVSQINSLTAQIAKLNEKMSQQTQSSSPGLLDERDKLVNQLSQYTGVKTVEKNGQLNVYLSGGQALVTGGQAVSLTAKQGPYGKKLDIYLDGNNISDHYKLSGSLGGLLDTRNNLMIQAQDKIGRFAATITSEFNQQNKAGYVSAGQAGGDIFARMQFNALANENNTGSGGINISFDEKNIGQLKDTAYEVSVTANGKYQVENTTTGKKTIYDKLPIEADGLKLSAVGDLKPGDHFWVNPLEQAAGAMKVVASPDDIAASNKADGSGTDNLNALADLANKKVMDGGQDTLTQGLSTIFSYIGGQAQQASNENNAAAVALTQANNDKQSVSGVNTQEEYTNLLHFQQSYSAAAKIVSTDQKLFDSVLAALGG